MVRSIGLPVGRREPIEMMVDDIEVRGAFLKLNHSSDWIEVRMEHPYQGSWMVRHCFHHRSPQFMICFCIRFAAELKLELEYRKMKAIDSHYGDFYPHVSHFAYPEI